MIGANGISTLNGTRQNDAQTDLPPLHTAQQVMDFMFENLIVEPPNNFDVTVTAEDGAQLGGTLTVFEKDIVVTRIGEFSATADVQPTTSDASSTSTILLGFAEAHQITPPPTNKDITVFAQNGATMNFIVSVEDFNVLVNSLPEFQATISDVDTTQDINSTFTEVLAFASDNQTLPPDDSVTSDMVTVSIGGFEIKNDRITGGALLIANPNFNSFWYGKQLNAVLNIENTLGQVLVLKEKPVTFTATERDETLTFDQSAFGESVLNVEVFCWVSLADPRILAEKKFVQVTEGIEPCPMGFHRENGICVPDKKPTGKVVEIIKGAFFGSLALALLGSRGR